jgi:hypothetical protein
MARVVPDLITEDENNEIRSTSPSTAGRDMMSDTYGDRSATNSATCTHSDVNGGLGTPKANIYMVTAPLSGVPRPGSPLPEERMSKTEKTKNTPKDELTKDRKKNMMYKWSKGLALFYPELPWVSIAC